MKSTFFAGSKLKIKRANKHIKELNRRLKLWSKKGSYGMRPELDPETGELMLTLESFQREKVADEVALIIGDAVHNLRAALDYAAHDLVRCFGGTAASHTTFPIRESRKDLIAALKGGIIQGLPLDVQTLLIELVQPYKGGNDALFQLYTWDNADKHQALLPVITFAGWRATMRSDSEEVGFIMAIPEQSREWGEIRLPQHPQVKNDYHASINVSLTDIAGMNQLVPPLLWQLSRAVEESIALLAALCRMWTKRRSLCHAPAPP